jgi:hypothetical protein
MTSATAAMIASVLRGLQARQHRQRGHVRDDAAEDLGVFDLSRHHRTVGAGQPKDLQPAAQLTERDPVYRGGRQARGGRLLEVGRGLFLDGDNRHLVAHRASGVEHEKGKPAVAGNQSQLHHGQSSGASSDRRPPRRRMTPRVAVRMKSTR